MRWHVPLGLDALARPFTAHQDGGFDPLNQQPWARLTLYSQCNKLSMQRGVR